jgi:DNA-binding LacI/PurR family transcriptional regulator
MSDGNRRPRPTIHDVARYAKVSIASVSRVLNNVPPISDELRAAVEAGIAAVGYSAKRSSASFQPSIVALIGDTANTYYSEILSGIQDQAARHGLLVQIFVHQTDPDFSTRLSRWLMRSPAEGLILCGSTGPSEEELIRIRDFGHIPIVAINRPLKMSHIPSVRIDYERAIAKGVRHIVQLKHRRIAFLNGAETVHSSKAKRIGVEKTLEELGFPLTEGLHVRRSEGIEGGFEAMNILLDLPKDRRPTAVIASNDLMALGAMHAIRTHGLAIPGDISVIGFDDIAVAAHANPPLTTISPPKFEMGAKAAELLLHQGERHSTARDVYMVMESPLIVRESSGPCLDEA